MNIISRYWQTLGFGIESKTDFAFLHDVIREKRPYYAYNELQEQFPQATKLELRKARLLFRLCNATKASSIRLIGEGSALDIAHITAACPKAVIHHEASEACDVYYAVGRALFNEVTLRKSARDNTLFIMEGIDNHNYDAWQQLLTLPHVVTYDMVTIGIATVHNTRYAEHYHLKKV